MNFQVLRIETYKKTSLRGLGGETERDGREKAQHKNVDIVKLLHFKFHIHRIVYIIIN